MAKLTSGATTDQVTIDPTSKAYRKTLYGPDGQALDYASGFDRGVCLISVLQAASPINAGGVIWSLRNLSATRTLYITRAYFEIGMAPPIGGAASEQRYQFFKYTGVTSVSGGTPAPMLPLLKRTSILTTDVEALASDMSTALTMTGGAAGAAFWEIIWARLTHSATGAGGVSDQLLMPLSESQPIELAQNEALAIQCAVNGLQGDILRGAVEFQG